MLSPVDTDYYGLFDPDEDPYSVSVTLTGIQEADHLEHFEMVFSGDYLDEDVTVEFEADDYDDGMVSFNTGEHLYGDVKAELIIDNEGVRGHSDPISDGELDYFQRTGK